MGRAARWFRQTIIATSCIILAAVILTACSGEKSDEAGFEAKMPKKKINLKVAGIDRQSFMLLYGNQFQALHPNVTFLFNELKDKSLAEIIPEYQPDVVVIDDLDQYGELALGGFVESLDGIILKESLDIESMLPGVIRSLKEKSDGALYGLAPTYKSLAIHYNATLFEEQGIDMPEGVMSWESVMQLANRFANHKQGEEAIYGLAPDESWTSLLQTIGWSYGIQLANVKARKMTLDTDKWRSVVKMMTDAIRSEAIPMPKPISSDSQKQYEESSFMQGQAAMIIRDHKYSGIEEWTTMRGSKFVTKLAPLPSGDNANAISPIQPDRILSVAAGSKQMRAAWELIKYAAGKDWAKQKGMTWNGSLLSRSVEQQDVTNKGIEVFYKGMEDMRPRTESPLPLGFAQAFELKLIEKLQQVAEDKLTVNEVVAQLQVEGQQLLGQS
ncbi:extracellular solute-binding protein [Paenibacillus xylaniclasticus]|uniref:extracellular solute-binding protein n=1 Tax=Paenibacillus xylaniclasticus TaxID=588083 RepID=UPI000FD821F0|nr:MULTISPECIES: extracellular solute-binding protein [Paenibacillus]GFN33314.1 hypothetical protein PCURB6_35740 [Paenibacillus curdlanolyticus]